MMNHVLAELENVSIYLDDVVLTTKTWDEHLTGLLQIFSRLQKINSTVNQSKCEFIQASVTFLGHSVGHGCVAPLQAKTLSISQYPAPTNRRDVCRFRGMAGYCRRFCVNFATVVTPMTSLLKK